MTETTRDSYGPYLKHAPVAAFNSISERCFERYHEFTDPKNHGSLGPREHIIQSMMYVAESTSYAVRLTATWAASLPAMSLCRDRYEQVLRFSYLAHQDDDSEWNKFLVDFFHKKNRVGQKVAANPAMRKAFEDIVGRMEGWETDLPTPEERKFLARWQQLKLDVCAERRDAMVKKNDQLPKFLSEPLRPLYESIYMQASSVTHYDIYSLTMLGHYRTPDRQIALAPDPQWPAILGLHCALFDIIQCAECLWRHFDLEDLSWFEALHGEWHSCCRKMGILD